MTREHKRQASISGTVAAVFARRFVVESSDGQSLANIGSDAVGRIGLRRGDKVTLKGKLKPAEIKVTETEKGAGKPICIERKKNHGHDERRDYQGPGDASAAVIRKGFEVRGEPRRKPSISRFLDAPRPETLPNSKADLVEQSASTSQQIFTNQSGGAPYPDNWLCSGSSGAHRMPWLVGSQTVGATLVARCGSRCDPNQIIASVERRRGPARHRVSAQNSSIEANNTRREFIDERKQRDRRQSIQQGCPDWPFGNVPES
jgi:hypothetical protein